MALETQETMGTYQPYVPFFFSVAGPRFLLVHVVWSAIGAAYERDSTVYETSDHPYLEGRSKRQWRMVLLRD